MLDLTTGAERARHCFGAQVAVVGLSPDGNVLAGVDWTGLVHVWDVRSGRSHLVKPDSLSEVEQPHSPVFSPDGSRMATATWGDPAVRSRWQSGISASGRRLGLMPCADAASIMLGFASTNRALIASSIRSPLIWQFDRPRIPPRPRATRTRRGQRPIHPMARSSRPEATTPTSPRRSSSGIRPPAS